MFIERDTGQPADFQVLMEIGIITQLVQGQLERIMPDGVSAAQFGVLNHFARVGGEATPAQLADAFQVTRAAMTNTLKRLETQGLVKIVADPVDGRSKRVSMTPAGAAARLDILTRLQPQIDVMRQGIDIAQFEQALPFLRSLREWLDDNRPE
jgi:DNA-binding MarR family transcriptional regulator